MTIVRASGNPCSFTPCGDPITSVRLGLCIGHYKQHWKGQELHVKRTTMELSEHCEVESCARPPVRPYLSICTAHAKQKKKGHPPYSVRGDDCDTCHKEPAIMFGACRMDADRARRGEIVVWGIHPNKECSSSACHRAVSAETEFCPSHNMRRYRGMEVAAELSNRLTAPHRTCIAQGCVDVAETKTGKMKYCPRHAVTFRRTGDTKLVRAASGTLSGRNCFVVGCDLPQIATGFCASHKARAQTYQLNFIQYNMLVIDAECRICGSSENLHIDHDHSCCSGKNGRTCGSCTRGMLCRSCNHGLGNFLDNPELLIAAVAYLARSGGEPNCVN